MKCLCVRTCEKKGRINFSMFPKNNLVLPCRILLLLRVRNRMNHILGVTADYTSNDWYPTKLASKRLHKISRIPTFPCHDISEDPIPTGFDRIFSSSRALLLITYENDLRRRYWNSNLSNDRATVSSSLSQRGGK